MSQQDGEWLTQEGVKRHLPVVGGDEVDLQIEEARELFAALEPEDGERPRTERRLDLERWHA